MGKEVRWSGSECSLRRVCVAHLLHYGSRLHPRAVAHAANVRREWVGARRAVQPVQRQQAARPVRPAEAGGDVEQCKLVRRVVRELGGEGGGGGALDLQIDR